MAAKKDFSQHALSIVEQVTGDGSLIDTPEKSEVQKSSTAVTPENVSVISGRAGGLKGGKIRAQNMPPEVRASAAKKAALARWSKR